MGISKSYLKDKFLSRGGNTKNNFSVKKSTITGANKGLFSNNPIPQGGFIGLAHENNQPVGTLGRMHNHSENPNMRSVKVGNQRYVYATRDIQPGEELTTNYRFQPELEQPEDFMGNKRFGQVGFQNGGEISTEKSPIEMPYVEIIAKRNPLTRVKPYKWDPNARSPLAKNTQPQDQLRTQYYRKPEEQMAGISETKKEDLRRKISGVLRETTQADKDWAAEQANRKALTFSGASDGSVLGGLLDFVNPAAYWYMGKDALRGAGETIQAAYEGNPDAVAAGLFKTGLNAAAFLPATQVGKFANAIGTEARLINRLKPLSVQRNLGDISKEAYKSLGRKVYQEAAKNPFNVSEYLTTQTPLKNTYKINPWAFKPNPEAYYRMLGKEGYADALESGLLRSNPGKGGLQTQQFDDVYFSMKHPWDGRNYGYVTKSGEPIGGVGYKGPYMAELTGQELNHPISSFPRANMAQSKVPISLENPGLKLYKQDWLRGYKEVPKPKTLPGSKTSYNIVRDSEGKIQFLDNETYRDALVTGKSNIVNYLSDPRYKAVVEGNQELANRLNMNRVLPIQKEMGNVGLHDARVAKINQPITILDPRSLETKIIQGTNEGVQAQYSRNLDGSGFLTIPRVYDKTKTIKNVEHETLHHVYPNLGEGLPSFTPLEARKAKAVFKDNAALRKIEEENNIPFWYLDDVDELVPNSFDLANDLGIAKFQKYPGVESFKKMLESYTGGKKFIKDALKLNNSRDYKRAWDMLSGIRLGIVPAIGVGAALNQNQQPKGTFQMGGTMGIPGVNGQVVSSGPQPLTSVKKTRGPITKTKKGDVKTMSPKAVNQVLKYSKQKPNKI